ncbi:MAG: 16S rRNA (adenine(1518)-N(6)/adenine(1519)-N(6))-dimethyltransferase RsmA [Clostridia bacterium]|nr:16S rRNA (adenine(1518)-N(6)/adenine(1519)-N(6))-dimethyltransferase RsmA [Clostridia bacterium]
MNLFEETKFIMKKYNIVANKSLGQNFLIDEGVVSNIVESAGVSENDIIIEIGPGLGTLTKYLLDKAKKVICIELDKRMVGILNDRFSLYDNFELINDDVLKVDLNGLIKKNKTSNDVKFKVVANLPYYITTPIIMKLLEDRLDIESITVMIQKEVAERLAAVPGEKETGSITYSINYYTNPEIVLTVPNNSFIPEPEVTSAVIRLSVLDKPKIKVKNEALLFRVIKVAFMQKRKTLVNGLVNGGIFANKEEAEKALETLGIDTKIRGEKLTLEQFGELADYI